MLYFQMRVSVSLYFFYNSRKIFEELCKDLIDRIAAPILQAIAESGKYSFIYISAFENHKETNSGKINLSKYSFLGKASIILYYTSYFSALYVKFVMVKFLKFMISERKRTQNIHVK